MSSSLHTRIVALALGAAALVAAAPHEASSQPRPGRPKPASQADIDRLERKIAEQQRLLERLIRMQQQYLQSLLALLPDGGGAAPGPDVTAKVEPRVEPKPPVSAPTDTGGGKDPKTAKEPKAAPAPKKSGKGTLVGKVKGGAGDVYVYIADVVSSGGGAASMKQEGKQFVPRVLAVPKGTRVDFPNLDAVFHNVFSVTPDNSFDLGSYRQGESKSVTMTKPGVVSVYCNMHPQMVGYILVTPSHLYTRAGGDGFYRLANVPAGKHKLVAWAPNTKPVTTDVEVVEDEVTTVELEVKKGRSAPHLNKDGMPYGSYKD